MGFEFIFTLLKASKSWIFDFLKNAIVSAGLLTVPLTAFTNESGEVVHLARRSNDTLNSDMLGAGTPPPSYDEVFAYNSTESIDQSVAVLVNPGQLILTTIWW